MALFAKKKDTLRSILGLVFITSMSSAGQAPAVSLIFDPATPITGTSLRFSSNDSGVVPGDQVTVLPVQVIGTQDGKYVAMLDSSSFHRDKFHRFSFDCYIKVSSQDPAVPVHKFTVWEEPIGKFADVIGPVTAHVSGANGPDIVTMQIPQHSEDSPNVTVGVPPMPYSVPMGHPSRMELGVNNNLANLHINVDPAIGLVATKCPECWGPFAAKVLHDRLGVGQSTSLLVDLQPNSLAAFKRNLVVFDSSSSQELLVATVVSQSDDEGSHVSQEFRIPVRFTPPGGFIILSVLCGVVIGCVIRFLISLGTPPKLSLLEIVITAVTAVVAWFLILVLFSTKTKATILGYDLDPTQVVTAGLISLLAAGGTPFSRRLAELIGGRP